MLAALVPHTTAAYCAAMERAEGVEEGLHEPGGDYELAGQVVGCLARTMLFAEVGGGDDTLLHLNRVLKAR